jgi:hypothetical protein
MATTTNYSWSTPDDTALVKDGAAAIRTLGSSADTTVKALNPGTTAGDIDYYTTSTTKARIAIGTANQQLRVNAGATAPEWFTPPTAASGLTFINRTAISAAATTTIDSLFSDTYENYRIEFFYIGSSSNINAKINFRYGSTTFTGANYTYGFEGTNINGTPSNTFVGSNDTKFQLEAVSGGSNNVCNFNVFRPASSGQLFMNGFLNSPYKGITYSGGLQIASSQAWGGIEITTSSGTITGAITVYGMAKS